MIKFLLKQLKDKTTLILSFLDDKVVFWALISFRTIK